MKITEEEIRTVFTYLGVPYDKREYKGVEYYWEALIRMIPTEIHHQTKVMKAKDPLLAAANALAKDWENVLPQLERYIREHERESDD